MQVCQGRRFCSLSADSATFGNPCHHRSRLYLKVVYTCVPSGVLRDIEGPEQGETPGYDQYLQANKVMDVELQEGGVYTAPTSLGVGSEAANTAASYEPFRHYTADSSPMGRFSLSTSDLPVSSWQPTDLQEHVDKISVTPYSSDKTRFIGLITEWLHTYNFLSRNKGKLVLCLGVSLSAGILSLVLVTLRLLRPRRQQHLAAVTSLPEYVDDLSDADTETDMDLTVAAPITIISSPLPGEVVRFNSEVNIPRSLSRSGNNQHFYG